MEIKEQVLKKLRPPIDMRDIELINETIKITEEIKQEQILKKIEKIPNKELAELFHNKYEETSRMCGWNTQERCKVKFKDLPKPNKNTMLITIAEIKKEIKKRIR